MKTHKNECWQVTSVEVSGDVMDRDRKAAHPLDAAGLIIL